MLRRMMVGGGGSGEGIMEALTVKLFVWPSRSRFLSLFRSLSLSLQTNFHIKSLRITAEGSQQHIY